jgi:hypothetical protein
MAEGAPKDPEGGAAAPANKPGKQGPATRVWLLTTCLTAATLLVIAYFFWSHNAQLRAALDDEYSRKSAYLAEEADLRIESYERLSAAVGSTVIRLEQSDAASQRKTAPEQYGQAQERLAATQQLSGVLKDTLQTATREKSRAAKAALESITAADAAAQSEVDARDKLVAIDSRVSAAAAALKTAETNLNAPARDPVRADFSDAGVEPAAPPREERAQQRRIEYGQALRDYRKAEADRQSAEARVRTTTEQAQTAYDQMEAAISRFGAADQNVSKQVDPIEKNVRDKQVELEKKLRQAAFAFENQARDDCEASPPGERRACLEVSIIKGLLEAKPGRPAVEIVQRAAPPELRAAPLAQVKEDSALVVVPDTGLDATASSAASDSQARYLRIPLSLLMAQGATVQARDGSRETLFDEVLLVDGATRKVLYASASDPLARAVTLPAGELKDPPSKYSAAAAPSILEIDLGSQRYLTFERPVRSAIVSSGPTGGHSASGDASDGSLVVVGLVREARMTDQVKALSPLEFLTAVVVTALAIFAWPLAKLWFVGAGTRFSRVDMVVFGTTSLAGTLLVALLVLTIAASSRLERRVDTQLAGAAVDIGDVITGAWSNSTKNVKDFIGEALKVVNALPDEKTAATASSGDVEGKCAALSDQQRTARWVLLGKTGDGSPSGFCVRTRKEAGEEGAWSSTFWANDLGYEQIQSTEGPTETPPVNLGIRDYFQRALASCSDGHKDGYVPEVVRSMTRTTKSLVVAQGTCAPNRHGIVASESDLTRFDLRIPPGIQWAAIDATGKVMLHSSLDAHHGHDLFEDLDPAAQETLRSAVITRTPATFSGEYEGAPSRLHVEQNQETGWYVVVIGSLASSHAIVADTLKTTVVAVGIFAICVGLLTVGAGLWRVWRAAPAGGSSSLHAFDLQPRASEVRKYCSAAVALGAGSVVLLVLALSAGPWVPTFFLLLSCGVLIFFGSAKVPGVWQAAKDPGAPTAATETRTTHPLWERIDVAYVACCSAFAVAAVVVPTVICFVGAFSSAAQNGLDLEQRALAVRSECDVVPARSASCLRMLPHVEPQSPADGNTEVAAVPPQRFWSDLLWPMRTVMGWMSSSVLPGDSAGLVCERNGWLDLDLRSQNYCLFHSEMLHLLGGGNEKTLIELGAGVLATVLLSAAVAFYSIKRLFFLGVLASPFQSTDAVEEWRRASAGERGRLFVLFPSSQAPPAEALVFGATDIADDANAAKTLEKVEGAAAPDALVLADVDPLRRAPESLRPRWARALMRFTVLRGSGRPNPSPSDASRFDDWSTSDHDEQRVLAQLAIDGHISPDPSNVPVLRHLLGRGLLDPDTLRIKEPAFAGFVATAVGPDRMRAWEAADTDVAWGILRVPLLSGVAFLVVLVMQVRPDLASGGALLIPPLVGGLPAALRLVASMLGGGNQATV